MNCIHWLGADVSRAVIGHEDDLEYVADTVAPYLKDAAAAADLPFPAIYRQLASRYEDAKFILIKRDPESWAESILKRYEVKKKVNIEPLACAFYWQYLDTRPTRTAQMDRQTLAEIYQRHCNAVTKFFAGTDRLGTFELSDPELSVALASFLGLSTSIPFPHSNSAAETRTPSLMKRLIHRISIPVRRAISHIGG